MHPAFARTVVFLVVLAHRVATHRGAASPSSGAGACDEAPCLNGGTCLESVAADGGSHRHLQDACTGASVTARTEEINAQCCGADDRACAAGIPTSCDSGCARAFLPFWKVSDLFYYASHNNRACLHHRQA